MGARVLAPSDITRRATGSVRVGGRVLAAEPTRLVVADALARLTALGDDFDANPGDLVVLKGRLARGVLTRAELVERVRAPEPRGDGELSRFCLGGTASRLRERA